LAIEFGITPDTRWSDVASMTQAARDAGFEYLGVLAGLAGPESRAAFEAAGLRCHEVLALMVSRDEQRMMNQAVQLTEAAGASGAAWVLAVFRDGLGDGIAPLIERCAAMFAEAGAKLAVEFSPLGPVSSIPLALELVDVAGVDRAGVLVDSWHFSRGDSTWNDLEQIPLERIAYVQFDDAPPAVTSDLVDETVNRRVMPGDGELELERFATTLLGRGWDGIVSVEVLNRQLCELPIEDFSRRAYDATIGYWR
jgi:sugar phosphate isomerase/epimerase